MGAPVTSKRVHTGHPGPANRCTLPVCTAHRTRYRKKYRLDQSRGITRTVDPAPVQQHVASLIGAGWSHRAIAGSAGLSVGVVRRALDGTHTQLQRPVAEALLAVCGLPSAPSYNVTEPFVPRVGTVRRIQALLALGWRHEDLYERTGLRTGLLLSQQGRWVTKTTHDGIAAVYRELSARPGPSKRTALRAERLGYLSPASWDDIDLDPTPDLDGGQDLGRLHEPADPVVVQRVLDGDLVPTNRAERAEITRRWLELGRSATSLERLTGWKGSRHMDQEAAA